MSIYEMFVEMWILDFQMGLFNKDYFKGLVQNGQLQVADYKKIVGEDYVAQTTNQTQPTA